MGIPYTSPVQSLPPLFAALADGTRLRLLNLLNAGEVCVCYFVEILGESQPKISRHLAYLRRVGLVNARRDGKWIHYSLAHPDDPAASSVVDATLAAITNDRQMQRDRLALEKVCCASPAKLPATLQNAPKPILGNIERAG
ncbi:MAG: ArsR family transcriptional regulator, arsenate/arsenite/antimonite-responsive transcriptional [Acidobacteriota bacterium]|nr:ArsR family transcriptional regulator, arsenate/arsenite/antimonite-responsive transcriptional [Acidobacteriota bacterium]